VEPAHASVFSRAAFAPSFLAPERLAIIPPSIDPFATKNRSLPRAAVAAILGGAGLLDSSSTDGRVTRRAEILRSGGPVRAGEPVVTQISRWDGLKDMRGVLRGFVEHVPRTSRARLILAGPSFAGVADDPEAEAVWNDAVADWESLAEPDRSRVQLVLLPLADAEENALVVNALQRHAAVVVQKSLAEGFGLTVTEAMWKSRAVVGGAVGGIVDQIVDGTSGVLVDPHDLDRFGTVVARLVDDPDERRRLGRNARARVKTKFLPDRHLRDHALLLARLLD
jgi:trehalose synthase